MRTLAALLLSCACACAAAQPAPQADHHQHVASAALAELLSAGPRRFAPIGGGDVLALLDAAGIRRAVLLSVAYIWGAPNRVFDDEYARVRAENDWAVQQAAQHPARLVAFWGFNPLKDYALQELARCAAHPRPARGIKLHFGNSDVQLGEPAHVARLQEVFRAANAHRMAIVVHLRASYSQRRPYGEREARIFLEQLLPHAPDSLVQVAHLAGSGPGYEDPPAQEVMTALADAVQRGDARTRNLWFDLTTVVAPDTPPATAALIAARVRQVGVGRVLYGSDIAVGGNLPPREAWAQLRRLPLTEEELGRIAANVAPYLQ